MKYYDKMTEGSSALTMKEIENLCIGSVEMSPDYLADKGIIFVKPRQTS